MAEEKKEVKPEPAAEALAKLLKPPKPKKE